MKRNNDDKNNYQNRKPPAVVASCYKLLLFKDKQDTLHEAKHLKSKFFSQGQRGKCVS